MIDKQFELRDARHSSLSERELSLKQESQVLKRFLLETEDVFYENKPVPGGRSDKSTGVNVGK